MITRVFGHSETEPRPSAIVAHLHGLGLAVVPHFRGDDLGWTGASLTLPGGGTPVQLDHYLTEQDGLRPDLNRFAAELETLDYSPHHVRLMEHVIQTRQLFTFRRPIDHADEAALERLGVELAQYLARETAGVYQVDGQGWFAADGELLVREY